MLNLWSSDENISITIANQWSHGPQPTIALISNSVQIKNEVTLSWFLEKCFGAFFRHNFSFFGMPLKRSCTKFPKPYKKPILLSSFDKYLSLSFHVHMLAPLNKLDVVFFLKKSWKTGGRKLVNIKLKIICLGCTTTEKTLHNVPHAFTKCHFWVGSLTNLYVCHFMSTYSLLLINWTLFLF